MQTDQTRQSKDCQVLGKVGVLSNETGTSKSDEVKRKDTNEVNPKHALQIMLGDGLAIVDDRSFVYVKIGKIEVDEHIDDKDAHEHVFEDRGRRIIRSKSCIPKGDVMRFKKDGIQCSRDGEEPPRLVMLAPREKYPLLFLIENSLPVRSRDFGGIRSTHALAML